MNSSLQIPKKNNYIPVLNMLRAVAAISVCLFHFIIGPVNFINNETIRDIFGYGKYGVQLFFVISGFIIPWAISQNKYNIKNYPKFLIKRLIRLEPPYLVSIVLVLIFYVLRNYFSINKSTVEYSTQQIALHIGYLIPFFKNYHWINEVYWTLAIEFQFYIFIGLAYLILSKEKYWTRIIFYIFYFIISFLGDDKLLPYWLPVFLLGNLLFLYKKRIIRCSELFIVGIIAFIFICFFMGVPIFVSCIIPFFAILFFKELQTSITNQLGKISYSIYLIHTIIGSAIINILSHHVESPFGKFIVVIAGLFGTIVASYAMYHLVEKTSQRLSKGVKYL